MEAFQCISDNISGALGQATHYCSGGGCSGSKPIAVHDNSSCKSLDGDSGTRQERTPIWGHRRRVGEVCSWFGMLGGVEKQQGR